MHMKRWNKQKAGFTVVELLIVIVVIGILVAITVASFTAVRNRGYDTSVQNDLTAIGKQLNFYATRNGVLPKGSAELEGLDIKVNRDSYSEGLQVSGVYYNLVYCWETPSQPSQFALVAQSKSGAVFQNVNGRVSRAAYAYSGGSAGLCTNAGVPLLNGSARDWFYEADLWQTYTD